MWVNSKEAAAILGVNNKSVEKAAFRAKKADKKFCSIRYQNLYFEYIDGRGGAAGKILQIWLDDEIVAAHNVSDKEGSLREIEEFRSEISPADITSSAITTRVGSLNFITKEANASGNDRKYASGGSSKDDGAGEYYAREFKGTKGGASAIPTLCKENAEVRLRSEDDGLWNLRTENKGCINGCTIYKSKMIILPRLYKSNIKNF